MGMHFVQLGDEGSLQDFKQLFTGADFHQGLELSFSSTPEGALSTRIGDKEVMPRFSMPEPCSLPLAEHGWATMSNTMHACLPIMPSRQKLLRVANQTYCPIP